MLHSTQSICWRDQPWVPPETTPTLAMRATSDMGWRLTQDGNDSVLDHSSVVRFSASLNISSTVDVNNLTACFVRRCFQPSEM